LLDSLHRTTATNPVLCELNNGLFLTYFDYSQNRQVTIWLQTNGTRTREDSLDLPDVIYAYGDGDRAALVTLSSNPWTRREMFAVSAFRNDGTLAYRDTLLTRTIPLQHSHGGHGLEFSDGQLTIVTSLVRTDVNPLVYAITMVRYQNRTATVLPDFVPGILPPGTHLFAWSAARGPAGREIIGFYVGGDRLHSDLWFLTVTDDGLPEGGVYSVPIGPSYSANSVKTLVLENSAFVCYTTQTDSADLRGGAYVLAFPLSAMLPATPRPGPAVPSGLALSASPNPFNGATRIAYRIARPSWMDIRIFDIAGRQVDQLRRFASSSEGSFGWNAGGLATGVYFIQLTADQRSIRTKLLLIR
jgi:hypothetical protein